MTRLTTTRHASSKKRLLAILKPEGALVDLGDRKVRVPISYRIITTDPDIYTPLLERSISGEPRREHAVAMVVDEGPWEPGEQEEYRANATAVAAALHIPVSARDKERHLPEAFLRANYTVLGLVTVGEYRYDESISELEYPLDEHEGTQGYAAGMRAVLWLAEDGGVWVENAHYGGVVHYYRHLHVHPACRGNGVAARVMAFAMSKLRHNMDATTSILAAFPGSDGDSEEQHAENCRNVDRLARLYEGVGFREVQDLRHNGGPAVMVHHEGWGLPWEKRFKPSVAAKQESKRAARPRSHRAVS